MTIRMLSWDLSYGGSGTIADPRAAGAHRLEAMAAVIDELRPDVVALQECSLPGGGDSEKILSRICDATDMKGHLTASNRDGALPVAVLWRQGTVEPLGWETRHKAFYHGAGTLTFAISGFPMPVAVTSLHLHPHSPEAWVIETAVFHMRGGPDSLTILMGDFNGLGLNDPEPDWSRTKPGNRASRCLPHHPSQTPVGDRRLAQRLAMAGFVDSCRDSDPAPTASHIRVDWILASAGIAAAVTAYQVGDDDSTGTREASSDHRPVWIDLDPALL
jgi:endonuclease/exonuclease/phosphatase family metal-dependent hydrolase